MSEQICVSSGKLLLGIVLKNSTVLLKKLTLSELSQIYSCFPYLPIVYYQCSTGLFDTVGNLGIFSL